MTSDDVISNDSPGYDPEIPNLSISSQISKCVNDRFERANNVIVFNLKEHVNKVEDDKLVESLILFIIGHSTTFKCTRLGKKEESITRPVKIKFHNLSVKNEFMHHLSKLKNAPSEFNNISIKHDMTPGGKQQLKIWYTNTDVFIMDKLHELSSRTTDEFPDIICIAEVKPTNFKRTLSLVKYNIVGYNTEALNIVQDTGRGMLLFIKKILNISW